MPLNPRRSPVAAATFDDVGIERALNEVLGIGQSAGVLLEHADENLPYRLAFGLRVGDPGQAFEEPVAGVDVDQFDALVPTEGFDDLITFAAPHQAGVDVDTRELMPDRLVDKRRGHGRIDAAAEATYRPGLAHLGTY